MAKIYRRRKGEGEEIKKREETKQIISIAKQGGTGGYKKGRRKKWGKETRNFPQIFTPK